MKTPFLAIIHLILFTAGFLGFAQNTKKDSLHNALKHSTDNKTTIRVLYEIAEETINLPDSSLKYAQKGLRLALTNRFNDLILEGFNRKAEIAYMRGRLDSASYYVAKSKGVYNDDSQAFISTNILDGKIKKELGDYTEAAKSYHSSILLAEKLLDTTSLIVAKTNLGNLYRYLEKNDDALMYYEEALDLSKRISNENYIASNLGNIGIIYRQAGNLNKALDYYMQSLQTHQDLGEDFHVSIDLMNIGVLYEGLEKYEEAKAHHLASNSISKKIQDDIGIVLTQINLGVIESKTKNYKNSQKYLDSALALSKSLNYKEGLKHSYFSISQNYKSQNLFAEAYENRLLYEKWNDSLINENHLKSLSELEIKYETQKKENELLKLSKEKQENDLALAQQNRRVKQLSFGFGVFAMLGLLGFLLFKQRLQNKKQEELLLAISETQTDERKRIAQDLHDGIGGSLALTKSRFEAVKRKLAAPVQEMDIALETLQDTTQQVRQISHNLMPGELVRFGLVAAINTLLETVNEAALNAQFHTNQEARLEPLKEVQLYRIVQEALQNVLKHAHAKNLFIQLNRHSDQLNLMIEDDGIGFAKSDKGGMGLKNIKQRVQLLKGSFSVDSTSKKGTILTVQIPV